MKWCEMRFCYHPASRGLSYRRSSALLLARTENSRHAEKCFKCNYRIYSRYKHNLYIIILCVQMCFVCVRMHVRGGGHRNPFPLLCNRRDASNASILARFDNLIPGMAAVCRVRRHVGTCSSLHLHELQAK
jgi:hypothetical protein